MHATHRVPQSPIEPAPVLGFPSSRPAAAYEAVLNHVGASAKTWSALCSVAREIEALGFRANLLALATTLVNTAERAPYGCAASMQGADEAGTVGARAPLPADAAAVRAGQVGDPFEAAELARQAADLQRQCAVAARHLHEAVLDSTADACMGNVPRDHARVSLESAIGLAQRLASIIGEVSASCAVLHHAPQSPAHAALAAGATASRTLDDLAARIDEATGRLTDADIDADVAQLQHAG